MMYNRQDLIQNAKKKKTPTEDLIIYVTRNTQTNMKKILKIFLQHGKITEKTWILQRYPFPKSIYRFCALSKVNMIWGGEEVSKIF